MFPKENFSPTKEVLSFLALSKIVDSSCIARKSSSENFSASTSSSTPPFSLYSDKGYNLLDISIDVSFCSDSIYLLYSSKSVYITVHQGSRAASIFFLLQLISFIVTLYLDGTIGIINSSCFTKCPHFLIKFLELFIF